MDIAPDRATLRLTDFGHAFEPADVPMPDVEATLEDRPVGGFGLYFIYQTVDEVDYQTSVGGNTLTLVKHLDKKETE